MSEIEELQRRITAALDRIGQGLERRQAATAPEPDTAAAARTVDASADTEDVETLKQLLDDERLVTAQLEARIEKLHRDLEAAEATSGDSAPAGESDGKAGEDAAGEQPAVAALESRLQGLQAANEKLRENNRALREANAAGLADPELIDTAMRAELEGLNAARETDRAEIEAVFATLGQAVNGTPQGKQTKPEGE
ncbi:hypothetical protein [Roseovarius salinarum]|uniref:hypothetical protein n=1 Tax=Roseovarius salinarum TaxID=1981892 RepID=UPI000C339080|nr:hypothetical protein [Roseovarius salinarum]